MPTPLGRGVLVASAVCYVLAWLVGYPELAVLAAAGLLAVLAAIVWTLPKPQLEVRREVAPAKVPREEAAIGVVTIVNRGRWGRAGLQATDVCGDRTVVVEIPRLPPGAERTVSYRLPTRRRGRIPVGPLQLVRVDPFGLARRVQPYGGREWLLVHPRLHPMPTLPSGRARHLDGPTSDTAPSGTTTFQALREYVVGDDLRHVHWRTTARTGKLMTRHLVDTSLPLTTVLLDLRPADSPETVRTAAHPQAGAEPDPPPEDEAFELVLEAAASVAISASRLNFPVRIITSEGPLLESRPRRVDSGELLDRLAAVEPDPAGALADAFSLLRQGRQGGSLVIVTAALSPGELTLATAAAGRFDRVVLIRIGAAASGRTPAGVRLVQATGAADLVAGWHRESRR